MEGFSYIFDQADAIGAFEKLFFQRKKLAFEPDDDHVIDNIHPSLFRAMSECSKVEFGNIFGNDIFELAFGHVFYR